MQVEFLIGPAGTGKTYRCLDAARAALKKSPEGLPLIFLAPKQATFQLERELLSDPDLPGYTRLQILSFDRLAHYVLEECYASPPMLLSEEGRVMVLRAILAREYARLQTFKASARMPGFAQELSKVLRQLQQHKLTSQHLRAAAQKHAGDVRLSGKLADLALLLDSYSDWLRENEVFDPNSLLDFAAEAIEREGRQSQLRVEALWLDGFAEMTPQEIHLLGAILPACGEATLAFCLEAMPAPDADLRFWSVPARTLRRCYQTAQAMGCATALHQLRRTADNRFADNRVLAHLEQYWTDPLGASGGPVATGQLDLFGGKQNRIPSGTEARESVRWFHCANPEMEATVAAREILRMVRDEGGRFRDAAVLLRRLEPYQPSIERIFRRYRIPFFVDQRRPVAHHPLAELTRYALRTVAYGWRLDDWFGALKSGFIAVQEGALDRLELEAIARGWEGPVWSQGLEGDADCEALRKEIIVPFANLRARICRNSLRTLNGVELSAAIRVLWDELNAEDTLHGWAQSAEGDEAGRQIHHTVWNEINQWLDNLQLAFPATTLPIEEWLTILEAGLCSLTVGVVPPALDQVLIGSVDRSRNPNLKLAIVLGMNEGVFPAAPIGAGLLTEADTDALEGGGLFLGSNAREQLAHERYLGYIACTRARHRLVLTSAYFDAMGHALNPSPFLNHLQRLFPGFEAEDWRLPNGWEQAEHPSEIIPALIAAQSDTLARVASLPVFAPFRERLKNFSASRADERLSEAGAQKLYGPELNTSITRLERFGECQFRFFVTEGLRARETRTFELDRRKLGDFQHRVLKTFHERLQAQKKRWRDLEPQQARELVGEIAREYAKDYHDGLFMADEQDRFTAQQLSLALEEMIEVLVGWMERYQFDPAMVELRFAVDGAIPAWPLPLSHGRSLVLNGSIDRVDVLRSPDGTQAHCVVIDYKSSTKRPDAVLMHNGVQMQLPAYLAVLQHLHNPEPVFGVKRLLPGGLFYVGLRRHNSKLANRNEAFAETFANKKSPYCHYGRFNRDLIDSFDSQSSEPSGQFNYRRTRDDGFHKGYADSMAAEEFANLTRLIEARLHDFGEAIFRGEARVNPFSHGKLKPCSYCEYRAICRMDSWTHRFRALERPVTEASG